MLSNRPAAPRKAPNAFIAYWLAVTVCVVLVFWQSVEARADNEAAAPILEVALPDGQQLDFTLDDLRQLPLGEFHTSTVWTEGVATYSGVMLIDLLRHIGHRADSGTVMVRALDGYTADITFNLISERAPLLAYLRNGQAMPVREQGPIWLIFPFDDHPEFRTESIYAKSVWQVRALKVQP